MGDSREACLWPLVKRLRLHLTNAITYWIAILVDSKVPIGGVKQLHRLAEAISQCKRQAILIQNDSSFHPAWFPSNVRTISFNDWNTLLPTLSPIDNIIVIPETLVSSISKFAPGIRKIIFNQNASYSFNYKNLNSIYDPKGMIQLYHHPDVLHVLCVSKHDHELLSTGFSLDQGKLTLLVNGIEPHFTISAFPAKLQVAYMSRKNQKHFAVVEALLTQQAWFEKWSLVEIANFTQLEVIETLQNSFAFLSFGHPEGFGLPLAEASACGCALVGYSGLGGQELFKIASDKGIGYEVSFGDWLGFIKALKTLDNNIQLNRTQVESRLLSASKIIRSIYSQSSMQRSVATALISWENNLTSN